MAKKTTKTKNTTSKPSKYNIPDDLDDIELKYNLKYTLVPFKSLNDLIVWFDEIRDRLLEDTTTEISQGYGTYYKLYKDKEERISNRLESNEEDWYGNPVPKTFEDAMARDRYQRMDEYTSIYNSVIKPMVQSILQQSKAVFELPTLRYNDRGLGNFDFAKASLGLVPIYKYYSFKRQDFVEGNEVRTIKDGKKYKYFLISDGSPVVIVPKIKDAQDPEVFKIVKEAYKEIFEGAKVFETLKKYKLKIGGKNSISSTIKKCYINKEKFPKPKSAIRLFIKFGANWDINAEMYKWTGYTAVGIAELLTLLGYSVSIVGIVGDETRINYQGKMQDGVRCFGATIKKFEETLDTPSLLYTFSDATFFRVRYFQYIINSSYHYRDYMNDGLGSIVDLPFLKDVVFEEYGKRDKLFNKKGEINADSQFLYYIIGDIYNQQDMTQSIREIGEHIVDENIQARIKMGYIEPQI
jgi:hypothetical protein